MIRILIYLVFGGVVLGIAMYGVRLIWRAYFPSTENHAVGGETETGSSLPQTWPGRLFLFSVVLLFLLMLVERAWVGQETPADLTPPPAISMPSTVQGPYY